jgi:hypothetical protein
VTTVSVLEDGRGDFPDLSREDVLCRTAATKHCVVFLQRFGCTLLRKISALAVPGHEDARHARYVANLFAKEVVLRNFGDPGAEYLLERMVEILTRLDQGRSSTRSGLDSAS